MAAWLLNGAGRAIRQVRANAPFCPHLDSLAWSCALFSASSCSTSAEAPCRACAAAATTAAGQGSFRDGGDGTDCYIKVPVGTIIRRKEAEVGGWRAGPQWPDWL